MVNWHKHIDPHMCLSCSEAGRGLFRRRPIARAYFRCTVTVRALRIWLLVESVVVVVFGTIYGNFFFYITLNFLLLAAFNLKENRRQVKVNVV